MIWKNVGKLKLIAVLCCVLAGIGFAKAIANLSDDVKKHPPAVRATWVWNTNVIVKNGSDLLAFAAEQKLNAIYLFFDAKVADESYHSFIGEADAKGIEVYALGGEPQWALTSGRPRLDEFIIRVKNYNAQAPKTEQFHGVHLDIEPYRLSDWKKDAGDIIGQWTSNVEHSVQEVKDGESGEVSGSGSESASDAASVGSSGQAPSIDAGGDASDAGPVTPLKISADLPFWLDQYSVAAEDGSVPLSRWMMRRYDDVTFMAYRNHAEGKGGILDILQEEIGWADEDGSKFVVGVETQQAKEKHVTFHQEGKAKLSLEIDKVNDALVQSPAYQGYAVHQYASWKELKN